MDKKLLELNEHCILVVSSSEKETLLSELAKEKHLPRFKLFSFEEFKNQSSYNYDENTILKIAKQYHVSMDLVKIYLDNLYYIDTNQIYSNEKLEFLRKIKIEQTELLYNPATKYLKNKKIYAYHHAHFKKELMILCDFIGINYEFLSSSEEERCDFCPTIHKFETLTEEIEYVANQIAILLENKIPTNQIAICIPDQEFYFTCKQIFKMYHIPMQELSIPTYDKVPFFNKFLEILIQTKDIEQAIENLKTYYAANQFHLFYVDLYRIFNRFAYDSTDDLILLLKYYFKNNPYYASEQENSIRVINYSQYIEENCHTFIIGINQGIVPATIKDVDYLSDNEKTILKMTTSLEKSLNDKKMFINFIHTHPNLFLSYHLKSEKEIAYPSFLINELNMNITTVEKDLMHSYSDLADRLNLARYYDLGRLTDEKFMVLSQNYKIPYNQYDNQFKNTGTDLMDAVKMINPKISYTSLNSFFECPFKYYLTYIANISTYEETLSKEIGNLYHEIVSKQYEPDFDFETLYQQYINQKKYSNKELFYFEKLKENLRFLIEHNTRMLDHTKLKTILCEKNIEIKPNNNIPLTVYGKIDKLMLLEKDGVTYVAVVDYKTGNVSIDLSYLNFGLSMQLPIYLYLIKNSGLFDKIVVLGFYLQHVAQDFELAFKDNTSKKDDSMKLQGYTLSDKNLIQLLDDSFENSLMIKNMKITKNQDFDRYSKVLSEKQMDEILEIVKNKLQEASHEILNANFKIEPKIIDFNNESCKYCSFKNICYVRANNNLYFSTKGGDENE